ncbi:MAG: sulfatase-like hydrolase/transferase, partial [Myxococcota bacterium]
HKPYTIPDDSRGFEAIDRDEEELIENGFRSLPEYNSFRLLDHSLGQFMQMASEEEYFDRTLFVLLGDNGTPGKMPNLPKAEEAHGIGTFHTPLAIYGPGLIREGKVYDFLATQMDVLPTIAGLAGWSLPNTTMGRNLFDPRFNGKHYALVLQARGVVASIGLVGADHYLQVDSDGNGARLHSYRSETPMEDVGESFPEKLEEMTELALGFYHTSKYLMYNNSPRLYSPEAPSDDASAAGSVTVVSRDD